MTDRPPTSVIPAALRLMKPYWRLVVFASLMGVASGIATTSIIAMSNSALHSGEGFSQGLLLAFAGLVILTLAGEIASDLGTSFTGQQVVASLRRDLVDRILAAPVARIEQFRPHRLIAVLNQDIDAVSSFTFNFSALAIAISVTLGCMTYLLYLDAHLFIIVASAVAVGVIVNNVARRMGIRNFDRARAAQDHLQAAYRSVIDGTKELKINRDKRHHVRLYQAGKAIDDIRTLRVHAMRTFMSANAVSSALFFAVIGLVLFLTAGGNHDNETVSGFVLTLLYVRGPVEQVVSALPMFAQAKVSLTRLAELSNFFDSGEKDVFSGSARGVPQTFNSLDLSGIRYEFPAADTSAPFRLGPIDLRIERGEALFIVGENGCGKTTLVKILLGLYEPQQGEILLDGTPVTPESRDAYRQNFAAVFFDYFLFDFFPTAEWRDDDLITRHMMRFEIAHKVQLTDTGFSTLDLSAGQRKRLAFIQALLDDRPIMVFDEWAAEQDPTFRRMFYEELLPELKEAGKTLVVVSHDDRYFHAADRIIHMCDGRIVDDTSPK